VGETILAMTTALFYAVTGMGSVFPHGGECGPEIDACWEVHKRLMGVQDPEMLLGL
jgi:hypothetical protein